MRKCFAIALAMALATSMGCAKKKKKAEDGDKTGGDTTQPTQPEETLVGVDMDNKILRIGALNDESGPAAAIGKPFAWGKRILAAQVNAGEGGLLPDGWKIELVERDHGYNQTESVKQYDAIKNDVLFIGTSFGTPNTLPLRKKLERDNMIAFPASLSSQMAEHQHTPPLGPSYKLEAMRAMDWAVDHAGGADKVKAGIVWQNDDYGEDGLAGWKAAADAHGVAIVAEQSVAAGQKDVTAVVTALKDKGANYVLLTTLPSATGPILGTAAQLQYKPIWIGNTPAWIDQFFEGLLPAPVLTNFYWVTGLPYWAEPVTHMDDFMNAYRTYGSQEVAPNFYIMASYVQGLVQLEAFRRALEAGGPVTREKYKAALRSIKNWDAGGFMQPVDLSAFPYVTGTKTRVLKPVMDSKTWEVVADYAIPNAMRKGTGGGKHEGGGHGGHGGTGDGGHGGGGGGGGGGGAGGDPQ